MYRYWELSKDVRIENGEVFCLNSDYNLGLLSDIDRNQEGEEVVEIEIDD